MVSRTHLIRHERPEGVSWLDEAVRHFIFMTTHDPFTEPHWQANRERVSRALTGMVKQFRTASLKSEVTRYINALQTRADNPEDYISDAVEDARHDLMLLAGIAEAVDLSNDQEHRSQPK